MSTVTAGTATRPAPRTVPGGEPPPRPRLRVVPPPAGRRAPRTPFALLVGGLLSAGLLTLLLLNTALAQGTFEVSDLERRSAVLTDRQQALEEEVAGHASPQRLSQRAAQLGMVPNENPVFIRAADGAVLGEPEPAKPRPVPAPAVIRDPRPVPARPVAADPRPVPAPPVAADPPPRPAATGTGAPETPQ